MDGYCALLCCTVLHCAQVSPSLSYDSGSGDEAAGGGLAGAGVRTFQQEVTDTVAVSYPVQCQVHLSCNTALHGVPSPGRWWRCTRGPNTFWDCRRRTKCFSTLQEENR